MKRNPEVLIEFQIPSALFNWGFGYHCNFFFFSFSAAKGVKRTNQTSAGSRTKKGKKSGESDVYLPIGSKDNSLFLFRALGKILYCKRKFVTLAFQHNSNLQASFASSLCSLKEDNLRL